MKCIEHKFPQLSTYECRAADYRRVVFACNNCAGVKVILTVHHWDGSVETDLVKEVIIDPPSKDSNDI